MFFEEDDQKIQDIASRYRTGELLTGELKEIFIDKLNKFLEKQREEKEKAKDKILLFKREGKLARDLWERKFCNTST